MPGRFSSYGFPFLTAAGESHPPPLCQSSSMWLWSVGTCQFSWSGPGAFVGLGLELLSSALLESQWVDLLWLGCP